MMALEGAAIDLANTVVKSIDNELLSFIFRQFMMIYEVRGEFENLQSTLSLAKAFLMDAEERQNGTQARTKSLIQQLKQQLVLEAEDVVDGFLTNDLRKTVLGESGGCLGELCYYLSSLPLRLDLSYKIKDIRKRYNEVKTEIAGWDSLEMFNQRKVEILAEPDSYVIASEVVGRDNTKEDIIKQLLQPHGTENVSLVAIIGFGGLGKTTVAQLVFNDKEAQNHFSKKIWVSLSKDFEAKHLLKEILKEGWTAQGLDDLTLNKLGEELREKIAKETYLLVLDNVWDDSLSSEWESLRKHLMGGGLGSKILVTTRSTTVAQTMDIDTSCRHNLQVLGKKESWDLFQKLAYTNDSKKRLKLVEIGEEIASKCGGVPLSIKTIAKSLRFEEREAVWSKISDDIHLELSSNEKIMSILKLSYYRLPIELRPCLAYCSIFPKNHRIDKKQLSQLWMAQGYLGNTTGNRCLEDVGDQYADLLLMRSFFHDAVRGKYGNVKYFKMHDLIHDLVQAVADGECYVWSDDGKVAGNPVHVSTVSKSFDVKDLPNERLLRSFLELRKLRDSEKTNLDRTKFYTSLRALYLSEHAEFMPWLKSLDKLEHLRYLDLSYSSQLRNLPEEVCNLINLQTLKLDECEKLENLPKGIAKLINLRCLSIKRCNSLSYIPAGFEKLELLQGLTNFIVGREPHDCAKLNILKGLTNLRGKIRIQNLYLVRDVASESQEAKLDKMRFLRSLSLSWDHRDYFTMMNGDHALQLSENLKPHPYLQGLKLRGYTGLEFPKWFSSLTSLVSLKLENVSKCEYVPPLNQLQSLECLQIFSMGNLKYVFYDDGVQFFLSLKELKILRCDKLIGWKRVKGGNRTSNTMQQEHDQNHQTLLPTFPHLSELVVLSCPKLTCIPFYPSVEELRLEGPILKSFTENMVMHGTQGVAAAAEIDHRPSTSTEIYRTSTASAHSAPLSKLNVIHFEDNYCYGQPIPKEGMKNVTSLEILEVEKLRFVGSLSRQFKYLTALKKLRINGDDTDIDWDALGSLCSLQQLSLLHCDTLSSMPDSICNLTSLGEIEIRYCDNLATLPGSMRGLTSLHKLQIFRADISSLECVGYNLPSLRELSIGQFKKMESLPESFRGLAKLQILSIWWCFKFDTLPEWIDELTSLREISIKDCGIMKSIPEGMRHLTNLESLIISNKWRDAKADRACADSWRANEHRDKVAHVKDVRLSWEKKE